MVCRAFFDKSYMLMYLVVGERRPIFCKIEYFCEVMYIQSILENARKTSPCGSRYESIGTMNMGEVIVV
eukprot:scaffold11571_cov122-Cylindrotheca_fusiformis.AAC.2